MQTTSFGIIIWSLGNCYHGEILGTDIKLFEESNDKLIKKAIEKISKTNDLYFEETESLYLKSLRLNQSLFYFYNQKKYSMPKSIYLDVVIAFGKKKFEEGYICFIPYFEIEFTYFDNTNLEETVNWYIREKLNTLSPEDIYNYTMIEYPTLTEIKVNLSKRSRNRIETPFNPSEKYLKTVANPFPEIKNKSNKRLLPNFAWERTEILKSIEQKIVEEKGNILLVGESGVGKTILIESVAKSVLENKKNKITFWITNSYRMLAGAKYLGDWQKICENIVYHLEQVGGVIYIQDIMQLMSVGGGSAYDSVASYLSMFLRENQIKIMGELTPKELERAYQILPSFIGLFQIVNVPELSNHQILSILNQYASLSKSITKVEIRNDSLNLAHRLLNKYIHSEKFPGKGIRFLSDCVIKATRENNLCITPEFINTSFSEKTGLPEIILKDEEIFKPNELEDFFATKIVGQKEVCKTFSSIIYAYKTGMNNPNKPIGTLLLAGSSGIGKTTSAIVLSQFIFGKTKYMKSFFRLDMSEFQNAYQIDRLIGSGKENPSLFLQHVRNNPFSVILLDEIEKAHPVFFDAIMTLLDEGILSDSLGREVNFKSSIILLTSNLGSSSAPVVGINSEEIDFLKAIKAHFRPEFLNRLDAVILMQNLDHNAIVKIARLELEKLKTRESILDKNIILNFSEPLVDWISEIGLHPKFGARPIIRIIEQKVVSLISRYILENKTQSNYSLLIDFKNNQVVIDSNTLG